eukprot:133134-Amorphochlora_amoeboformis.AAC.1
MPYALMPQEYRDSLQNPDLNLFRIPMRSRMKGGRNNSIDLGDEDPSPLLQKARNASSESLPTVNQDVDLMEMEEEPPVGYYQQKSPPRERFPWKEAMLAVILTLGGVVFLPIGLYELVG